MKYVLLTLVIWPVLFLFKCIRSSYFRFGSVSNAAACTGRVLLIQTAKIGDWVNSTPVIRALAPVDVLCSPEVLALAQWDSHIRQVEVLKGREGMWSLLLLALRLYQRRYTQIVVLMPNVRNLFLARLACAREVRCLATYRTSRLVYILSWIGPGFIFQPHHRDKLALHSYLTLAGITPTAETQQTYCTFPLYVPPEPLPLEQHCFRVGISLAAGNRLKTLPLGIWESLFDLLQGLAVHVYIFGVEGERGLLAPVLASLHRRHIKSSDWLGKCRLEELAWYLGQMHLYISTDTGNSYIADSQAVPVINFAGPCYIREQRPLGEYAQVIETEGLTPFSFIFSAPYESQLAPEQLYQLSQVQLVELASFIQARYTAFQGRRS